MTENLNTIKEKVNKAKNIISSLKKVAEIDGKITEDERKVILQIGYNLEEYFSIVRGLNEDNVLTKSEELHIIEKKIVQDATAKAFEDGRLSGDEKNLLSELVKLMEEIA